MPKTRLHHETGAASIEAVVLLPCFLLLFFAIYGIHSRYEAKQRALANARHCAWVYSQRGCAGPLPPGCSTRPSTPRALAAKQYVESDFSTVSSGTEKPARLSGVIENQVGEPQRTLFGRYINATSRISPEVPDILGWDESDTQAKYHLACNLEPQRLSDVLSFLWDAVQ
jgi:hypothetical protein